MLPQSVAGASSATGHWIWQRLWYHRLFASGTSSGRHVGGWAPAGWLATYGQGHAKIQSIEKTVDITCYNWKNGQLWPLELQVNNLDSLVVLRFREFEVWSI